MTNALACNDIEVTGSHPTFDGITQICFSNRYVVFSTEERKMVCVALQEFTVTCSVSASAVTTGEQLPYHQDVPRQ